jgi:hypothetical protein
MTDFEVKSDMDLEADSGKGFCGIISESSVEAALATDSSVDSGYFFHAKRIGLRIDP